ncbi:hypothetical protein CP533_2094 [Ophiocordyceps camponoti-saundersi (nom. inval.)]|nr:hypothetical protein CP533_2094 [Ophiocordyceps camponoti-saundersi (nom. inval.)]
MLALRLLLVFVTAWPVLSRTVPQLNLKKPPQRPPLFNMTVESMMSEAIDIAKNTLAVCESIVANVTPENATFDNVLLPVQLVEADSLRYIMGFLHQVSPDAEIRKASVEVSELLADLLHVVASNSAYRRLVKVVMDSATELEEDQRRTLGMMYHRFILSDLADPFPHKKIQVSFVHAEAQEENLQTQLKELTSTARKNLRESTPSIWFSRDQLDGLPAEAINKLENGTGEHEGKLRVALRHDQAQLIMRQANNETTRRDFFVAFQNRHPVNAANLPKIIQLRDSIARQFGYDNHASIQLQNTMAESPAAVKRFLDDLRLRMGPLTWPEDLVKMKKSDYEKRNLTSDGGFYEWDRPYYSNLKKKDLGELIQGGNRTDISEYFPFDSTLERLLNMMGKLFGLVFVELDAKDRARLSPSQKAEDLIWHPDVKMYAVWDDEGAGRNFSGYMYFDPFRRQNKFSHAAMMTLMEGFLRQDGSRNYPVVAVVCNVGEKAKTSDEVRITHESLVVVMHELGHAIHHLVTRTRYPEGIMPMDFVEAPSQMLENWAWQPKVLKSLSRHWKTNEPLPDNVVKGIAAGRGDLALPSMAAQVMVSVFDMTIHSPPTHEAALKIVPEVLWNQLRRDILDIQVPKDFDPNWSKGYASIGHLYSGYDTVAYSYLWSVAYADDMFSSAFAKDPFSGDEGRRYRKTVLEPGGSRDLKKLLVEFLGREPDTKAFFRMRGLEKDEGERRRRKRGVVTGGLFVE